MATFLHISTRGLLFITIITGNATAGVVALAIFIFADGILGYYYHITGKLATKQGYLQVHIYLFILTAIATAAFFILIAPYQNISL